MNDDPETTEDALLAGKVHLRQQRRGHRAGTDAVLLAAVAAALPGGRIVDVGAASGAIGLMLGRAKADSEIVFIEQDPFLAQLCQGNIADNGLSGRARIVAADIFDPEAVAEAGILPGSADLVVSNPPFIEEGRARLSPDARRRKAHALPKDGLRRWVAFCTGLLRSGGTLAMIHRADRLPDCLACMPPGFGAYRIRMVHPRLDEAAVRVLILATRDRKTPALIEPPLVLHGADGAFTGEARALHEGDWLPEA